MESGYMSLSLSFDFFAFVTVVVLAYRSNPSGSAKQRLFTGITGTVVRGAIIYFALIFVSHLILVMFIYFAKVRYTVLSIGTRDSLLPTRFLVPTATNSEVAARIVSCHSLMGGPLV